MRREWKGMLEGEEAEERHHPLVPWGRREARTRRETLSAARAGVRSQPSRPPRQEARLARASPAPPRRLRCPSATGPRGVHAGAGVCARRARRRRHRSSRGNGSGKRAVAGVAWPPPSRRELRGFCVYRRARGWRRWVRDAPTRKTKNNVSRFYSEISISQWESHQWRISTCKQLYIVNINGRAMSMPAERAFFKYNKQVQR